ncbi:hypothetical protein [Cecembia rubra]|uniref:hypothetical protein n=1 Tax=Cecembia rubra TaxID=1485585 RepID=UPI00271530C3|nr:hypothetical protein [Cecembia rubra]
MKKFLILFLFTALVVFFLGGLLPYWGLMLAVALIAYFVAASSGVSFIAGGIAFGLAWFVLVMRVLVQANSDLPEQIAELMGLKNDNLLWFATALLGFLIGGFSAMTGSLFKRLFEKKNEGFYRR